MRRLVRSMIVVAFVTASVAACGGVAPSKGTAAPSALEPGTYTTRLFQPTVTFTVPAGWESPTESAAYLQLRPVGSDVNGIHLFSGPVAASQDPSCPPSPEAGVGATSSELQAWLRQRPGLTVGPPTLATVGGLRGVAVDLAIAPGWTASCPFANGSPTVPLIVGRTSGYHWIIVGNERLRMYLLDLPGGGTLIVDVDAFDGTQFDALVDVAAPIVRSFQFVSGSASSPPAATGSTAP